MTDSTETGSTGTDGTETDSPKTDSPVTTSTPAGGITVVPGPRTTTAKLWGEIDEALRDEAGDALEVAVDRELPVVIDAGEVTFIDSTGIAFLIQFCRVGREEGLTVTLHNPPTVVTDVLGMLGLDEMWDGVTHE